MDGEHPGVPHSAGGDGGSDVVLLDLSLVLDNSGSSAGLNVLAVIPVVSDGGKIVTKVTKVTKFVSRVPRTFSQVTRLVATTSPEDALRP